MPTGTRPRNSSGQRDRSTKSFSNRARQKNSRPQAGANNIANTKRRYEHYITLARNAVSTGDMVDIENFYQHAEHYLRQMRPPAVS